jgi:hypothetical protein
MNSPNSKSPSRTALHHTLPLHLGNFHLSSCLSLLRLLSDQKREVERMDAIAMDGGWDMEGGRELKSKGRKSRSLGGSGMRERESASEILSPLPTLVMLGKASCAVLGVVTPCATRITVDK